jgi:23S rRNA U2552 (ribose-2'-O)-methylase RlmE/FtsJ
METDKTISGLEGVYKKLLSKYKGKKITILEIGVWNGGSMLMYEKQLPDSKIYGIDILPRPECLKNSSVITRVLDQNDTKGLEALALEAGGFDVIIDDGSHFTKETKKCFVTLWKHVKEGGMYIIEDWAVAIKEKNSANIAYKTAVIGMSSLVFDIACGMIDLGLGSANIVVEKNWRSYAVFKK